MSDNTKEKDPLDTGLKVVVGIGLAAAAAFAAYLSSKASELSGTSGNQASDDVSLTSSGEISENQTNEDVHYISPTKYKYFCYGTFKIQIKR